MATFTLAIFALPNHRTYAQKFTPESQEVRAMIDSGVKYLESRIGQRYTVGYEVLVGYAVFMANNDVDHPCVKKGLNEVALIANAPEGSNYEVSDDYVYACGASLQFVVAIDPIKYAPEMQKLFQILQARQRPDGSWGHKYKEAYKSMGDTSQTQYALLGLWSLDQANFPVPHDMIERAFHWLADTQYPDGSYAHRAPSREYSPNHHMTAVGMSSTMIAGDILRILRSGGGSAMAALEGAETSEVGVPVALRRVVQTKDGATASGLTPASVRTIVEKADRWMKSNTYKREMGTTWHYYMLYSVERYQAFMEAMNGRRDPSPQWYNDIVKELKEHQSGEGSWSQRDSDAGSIESSSAFAILVLLRATQKSIGELNTAVLRGGQGLQADMSSVDFSDEGKVEDKKEVTDIEAAMKMLEGTKLDKDVSNDLAKRIKLDPDPDKRNDQLQRFARMLRSDSAVTRRVAAKVLCRGDNLEMVPHLIYALSDPDGITNINAENSLRVLSRQLKTFKIPEKLENGKLEFPVEVRRAAQDYWKEWFLSVRPDYLFLDE